ncbi:MAG TPA: hypothetical protein VGJ06_19995 [Candidatus Acidoferrum sp.]
MRDDPFGLAEGVSVDVNGGIEGSGGVDYAVKAARGRRTPY